MDLNKSDLLKILSYLEGELQAREIVIATLKCEKVKSMLSNRKNDCTINDPLSALQRDCFASTLETNNDRLSYQQLGTLESLVLQQRKTHLKIANVLKDNQLMHRKILDIECFKNQQLRLDYKKLQTSFEVEHQKHKQIIFFLLAERKKFIMKYIEERKRSEDLVQILSEEKIKIASLSGELEEETKKSLQIEAELEKQINSFDVESKKIISALNQEEKKVQLLETELKNCRLEIVTLEKQLNEILQNNCLESSNSSGEKMIFSKNPLISNVTKIIQPTTTVSSYPVSSPLTGTARSVNPGQNLCLNQNDIQGDKLHNDNTNFSDTIKKPHVLIGRNMQSENVCKSATKKNFGIQQNISGPNSTENNFSEFIKKHTVVGRGIPPPVPPNKPVIPPKKDLLSFIKKTPVSENTVSTTEQKNSN